MTTRPHGTDLRNGSSEVLVLVGSSSGQRDRGLFTELGCKLLRASFGDRCKGGSGSPRWDINMNTDVDVDLLRAPLKGIQT